MCTRKKTKNHWRSLKIIYIFGYWSKCEELSLDHKCLNYKIPKSICRTKDDAKANTPMSTNRSRTKRKRKPQTNERTNGFFFHRLALKTNGIMMMICLDHNLSSSNELISAEWSYVLTSLCTRARVSMSFSSPSSSLRSSLLRIYVFSF